MPQRVITALSLALAVCGVAIVGVLVVLRVDAHRAAVTGPRWKRRLVAAGLVLLGAVGASSAQTSRPDSRPTCYERFAVPARAETRPATRPDSGPTCYMTPSPTSRPAAAGLAERAEWKQVCQAWGSAREVVSGAKGEYPFDEAGRKALQQGLELAGRNVTVLREAGALTGEEATLLRADLKALTRGVNEYRPTEQKDSSCYLRGPWRIPQQRVAEIAGRLALLEAMAQAGKVPPAVVARVLATLEREAAALSDEALAGMTPEERAAGQKVRQAAVEKAKAIREKLPSPAGLEARPEWKTISDALAFAEPLARTGKSTQAQRKAADEKLAAAKAAATALGAAGLLAAEEASLLQAEGDRIREQIRRNPPTDSNVTCYKMAYVSPARKSLERLSQRLPLLRSLAASGAVHPGALAKVVPAIEADLAALSAGDPVRPLTADEQARAAEASEKATAELAKLKKMMAEGR